MVNNGSFLSAASIRFSDSATSVATGLFDGANTRVDLTGDGNTNRLELGAYGRGSIAVSGGATLDGRANSAACLIGFQSCANFVGNAAGSDALLTITGANSNASFLRAFVIGGLAVFPPGFGTPGGATRARVEVLNGARLTTDEAQIGAAPGGSNPLGTERSFAEVLIDGPNSVWRVTGGTLETRAAFISTATHRNAVATMTVSNGGKWIFEGPGGDPNLGNGMNLSSGGGRTDLLVTGTGSQISLVGDNTIFQIGRNGGSALVTVQAGGSITGSNYTSVGRSNNLGPSFGELVIDGTGALYSASGVVSVAGTGFGATLPTVAAMDIGRDATGVVTVRNGGRLEVVATTAGSGGPGLRLGRGAAGSGTLNITGAGSVVAVSALSTTPGGGATEAFNPNVRVGADGYGALNITQGGKLLIDGQAVATVANSRNTILTIGGNSTTAIGGRGTALVSGLGSEIRLTGSDSLLRVATGPQSVGLLTVSDQASISSMNLVVGDSGGTGVLKADRATLNLSGQQTGDALVGAGVFVGNGGGIGIMTLANGSQLNITNPGTAGAGMSLGGLGSRPLGSGSLTLSGASQLNITAAPGLAYLQVGRIGTGLLEVKGASTVNVGDGNITIARLADSAGTLLISENSVVNAGWLGVGRYKDATGDFNGGVGTALLTNGALNAQTIVIGSKGYLGGTGTIAGNVTNYGTFSPGNSPGTLEIDGDFTAAAGSRVILEVESNASGGFNTDRIVFRSGKTLDLSQLNAEFRFLGNTDPTAFQASGQFDLDTFFQVRQNDDSLQDLAPSLFDTATFSAEADSFAISSFSFNPVSGATFSAAPVPRRKLGVAAGWSAGRRWRGKPAQIDSLARPSSVTRGSVRLNPPRVDDQRPGHDLSRDVFAKCLWCGEVADRAFGGHLLLELRTVQRLVHRRYLGQGFHALPARNGQCDELTVSYLADDRPDAGEQHLRLAGHQVDDGRCRAR